MSIDWNIVINIAAMVNSIGSFFPVCMIIYYMFTVNWDLEDKDDRFGVFASLLCIVLWILSVIRIICIIL